MKNQILYCFLISLFIFINYSCESNTQDGIIQPSIQTESLRQIIQDDEGSSFFKVDGKIYGEMDGKVYPVADEETHKLLLDKLSVGFKELIKKSPERFSTLNTKGKSSTASFSNSNDVFCQIQTIELNFQSDLNLDFIRFPHSINYTYCSGICSSAFLNTGDGFREKVGVALGWNDENSCVTTKYKRFFVLIEIAGIIYLDSIKILADKCKCKNVDN